MKKSICLYFQVHQPTRLRLYRFFDIGKDSHYYDDFANRTILRRVADRCYLPMNAQLLEMIKAGKGKRDISVFSDNAPSGVQTGDTFSVDDIRLVKWGARKDRNGYWHDFVSVNGVVKQISSAPPMPDDEPPFYPAAAPVDIYADIKEGMMDDDDDLPW